LFGTPPRITETGKPPWAWLTPATALFFLVMVLQSPHSTPVFQQSLVTSPEDWSLAHVPEQAAVAYLADAMHSPRNLCQLATFEWTKPVRSLTTTAPFLGTNILFH